MASLYRSEEAARTIRTRYLTFLRHWPVASQRLQVPTCQGETFIMACGDPEAPPLVLLHGALGNSAMWMGDVAAWAAAFRVYAVDVIGEPGLSAPSRPALDSDSHARWLDDVLGALSIDCTSLIGMSFGGWIALDYATRRPERVQSLVVICPAGVGRQKIITALQVILLRCLGRWGKRRIREVVLGRGADVDTPRRFREFVSLIDENFRPRIEHVPSFTQATLRRLTMPVLAIVGGRDVLFDSDTTKRKLERAGAEVLYLPEAGHFISGQKNTILAFLQRHPRDARVVGPEEPTDNMVLLLAKMACGQSANNRLPPARTLLRTA